MSLNGNKNFAFTNRNPLLISNIPSTEVLLLYCVTIGGIVVNLLTMLFLLIIPAYRIKSSCFLFHHCLICLTLSILCLPYALSFSNYQIRCDYLGNIQVTCVTAQLLNIAAMVASEAYRFEDLIHQDNSHPSNEQNSTNSSQTNSKFSIPSTKKSSLNHHHYFEYQLKQSSNSTISCGCLSFGILIIWFSSVILHLGITMIGTEWRSYYHELGNYCNFIITDIRGYVLTLMWIIITTFSLIITVRYIHKVLKEVSSKRRHHQPLLSLAILGQSHGQSIASRDILMQQIEQRIKLNILLIVLFILFWFPLFLVTLFDIKFKIPEKILRYLLLVAWSNSSLSSLGYLILFPKCSDLCSFCWKKDRTTAYDSLTSYYNRIGDRFHDIGKWDQFQKDEVSHQSQHRTKENLPIDQQEEKSHLNHRMEKKKARLKENCFDEDSSNMYQLKPLTSTTKHHSKTNSLIVKEISPHENHLSLPMTPAVGSSSSSSSSSSPSPSSSLSLSSYPHRLSNGLLVTSTKTVHL